MSAGVRGEQALLPFMRPANAEEPPSLPEPRATRPLEQRLERVRQLLAARGANGITRPEAAAALGDASGRVSHCISLLVRLGEVRYTGRTRGGPRNLRWFVWVLTKYVSGDRDGRTRRGDRHG